MVARLPSSIAIYEDGELFCKHCDKITEHLITVLRQSQECRHKARCKVCKTRRLTPSVSSVLDQGEFQTRNRRSRWVRV